MLYYLLEPYIDDFAILNLIRYLTFRTGLAVMTALIVSFIFGPKIIKLLKVKQKKGQPIREDGPQSHIVQKAGTPTMGGFLILLSLSVGTLLWADLSNHYIWSVLIVTIGFGLIGFLDDYMKVSKRSSDGLAGKKKLLMEVVVTGFAAWWIAQHQPATLAFPFFKDLVLDLGVFYIPFAMFVMIGSGNAVNLTDGLDGLATMPVIIAAGTFGIIAYLVGHAIYAPYLQIAAVPGAGELVVFCGALIGAGLGFLWYNAPPAMVFMGDTGSLSLGGALGAVAVITKHEIVLAIVGGIFVLETVSVVVQVASFKLTGKRVFRMAPIHHHFEAKGWAEPTIVIRFWIISVILALVGLATLKLR